MYPFLLNGIKAVFGQTLDSTILIALFNMLLNTITALLTIPLLKEFVDFINSIVPSTNGHKQKLHIEQITISKYLPAVPGIMLRAITEDTKIILQRTGEYLMYEFELAPPSPPDHTNHHTPLTIFGKRFDRFAPMFRKLHIKNNHPASAVSEIHDISYDQETHKLMYLDIKDNIETILTRLLPIKQEELEAAEEQQQGYLETAITSCIETLKLTKSIREDIDRLRGTTNEELQSYYATLRAYVKETFRQTTEVLNVTSSPDALQSIASTETTLRMQLEQLTQAITKHASQAHTADIPLSTTLNIDKHISFIHNYYFKALEAYAEAKDTQK